MQASNCVFVALHDIQHKVANKLLAVCLPALKSEPHRVAMWLLCLPKSVPDEDMPPARTAPEAERLQVQDERACHTARLVLLICSRMTLIAAGEPASSAPALKVKGPSATSSTKHRVVASKLPAVDLSPCELALIAEGDSGLVLAAGVLPEEHRGLD